jgi:hypothetical protein
MSFRDIGKFILDAAPSVASMLFPPAGPVLGMGKALLKKAFDDTGVPMPEEPEEMSQALREHPEIMARLQEINADVEKGRIELDKFAIGAAGDLLKTAIRSDDPVVRRARPEAMKLALTSCVSLAAAGLFVFLLVSLYASSPGAHLDREIFKVFVDGWVWVVGFLATLTWRIASGYIQQRSKDKAIMAGFAPPMMGGLGDALKQRLFGGGK